MTLTEMADTLKAGVELVDLNPTAVIDRIRNGTLPKNQRDFTYKNRLYRFIFTLDVLPTKLTLRHLSIGTLDNQPLDDEAVGEIVSEFFTKPLEMPSVLHDSKFVRHYIEKITGDKNGY